MSTSELEKLHDVAPRSQAIGEFLDWVRSEKGWQLATLATPHVHEPDCKGTSGFYECGFIRDEFMLARYDIQRLLAEFFGIDLEKVETEKRELLDSIRANGVNL